MEFYPSQLADPTFFKFIDGLIVQYQDKRNRTESYIHIEHQLNRRDIGSNLET